MNKVAFLQVVTEQIKNKAIQKSIYQELNNHFDKSIQALVEDGYNEAEAEEITITRMGNPAVLGAEMNEIHRPKIDWSLILAFCLLQVLSILPLFLSLPGQIDLKTKLIQVVGSFILVLAIMFFDYRKLMRYTKTYFIICFIILGLLYTQKFTIFRNGNIYLHFPPFILEVSFILLFCLFGFTSLFTKIRSNEQKLEIQFGEKQVLSFRWIPSFLTIGLFLILFIIMVPVLTLPTILLMSILFFLLYFYTFRKQKGSLIIGAIVFVVMPILTFLLIFLRPGGEMFLQRILSFFSPGKYSYESYLYEQIEHYLQAASLFGDRQEAMELTLPSAYTDFAFVTFVYAFGWLLAGLLIFLFLFIALRIIGLSQKTADPFGKLLSLGIFVLLAFPFGYSILMAFGIVPITSFSLPFFSYGTVSLILNACYIGLILSVYRRKDFPVIRGERAV